MITPQFSRYLAGLAQTLDADDRRLLARVATDLSKSGTPDDPVFDETDVRVPDETRSALKYLEKGYTPTAVGL